VKAVSTLLATALLIVITIAGGMIIYNYVMNSLEVAKQYSSLNILSVKALVLEGNTVINIKATNIGTAKAVLEKVVIIPGNITIVLNTVIEPGETKSINVNLDTVLNKDTRYYIIIVYNNGETEPYPIEFLK